LSAFTHLLTNKCSKGPEGLPTHLRERWEPERITTVLDPENAQ
jgi:hypothetical protein